MIIIKQTQTKKGRAFHVVNTGDNREILKPTESFPRKQKCWVNILADTKNYFGCTGVYVQDDSLPGKRKGFTTFCSIEVLKKKAGKK